jgi:hypothetical protein
MKGSRWCFLDRDLLSQDKIGGAGLFPLRDFLGWRGGGPEGRVRHAGGNRWRTRSAPQVVGLYGVATPPGASSPLRHCARQLANSRRNTPSRKSLPLTPAGGDIESSSRKQRESHERPAHATTPGRGCPAFTTSTGLLCLEPGHRGRLRRRDHASPPGQRTPPADTPGHPPGSGPDDGCLPALPLPGCSPLPGPPASASSKSRVESRRQASSLRGPL